MSQLTRPFRTRPARTADATAEKLRLIAIVLCVVGFFISFAMLLSIGFAVAAGLRGERRAWWIIPVAFLVAIVGTAARTTW